MRNQSSIVALVILAGCATHQEPIYTARSVPQYTIEDFLETTSISGASFSPDETKILVSSDESGVFNAYAIPVDGGEPVRLTDSSDNSIFAVSYFPEGGSEPSQAVPGVVLNATEPLPCW